MLYDLVADLGLPTGAVAIDVGCGEGKHTIQLAERFGLAVTGFDPVPRHIQLAVEALRAASERLPELSRQRPFRARVRRSTASLRCKR